MSVEVGGQQLESENVTGILAGAAVDGWDATSGTTADPAWGGTGAASKIALLKAIAAGTGGTDPASPAVANQGTGPRGWLATITSLLALGTQTKAKSASVRPASDLANMEPAGTAISATSMPAGGTGLTGWLSAAYYALTTLGATTDAPVAAATTTAAVTLSSVLKGLVDSLLSGTAKLNTATWWLEGTAGMTISAGTNFNGASRATSGSGVPSNVAYFTAKVNASTQCQVAIGNGSYAEYVTIPANTPTAVKVPVSGPAMSASLVQPNSGSYTATLTTMLSAA